MRAAGRIPKILWLILGAALVLRLLGGWRANLIFDERAHLALAETISFQPESFHLVSRSLDHPLMSIYLLKLSGVLFGTSDFGLRILHLLIGTLTVLPVYFLGKRTFSEKAGLWAAALLAVDQFHASWSRVFMPEVLLLFLTSLVLLQFLRAAEADTTGSYLLLGLLLGLSCLAKEPAILLIPMLWTYLLLTPEHRRVLRRPAWYLAHGVFLAVIAPDVIWNLTQLTESYLYRDAVMAAEPVRFSMKSFSLYLGEAFQAVIGGDVLGDDYRDYLDGNVYACCPVAGALYLAAVAAVLGKRHCPAVRLLLVAFLFVFVAFLFMPGGKPFEPFWWASMSLIPAVVCAGWILDWAASGGRVPALAGFLLLGYLALDYLPAAWREGPCQSRDTVEDLAASFLEEGNGKLDEGELRQAESRFIYVLNIAGPHADAYLGLARVAEQRARPAAAERMLQRALKLDPGHPGALQWRRRTSIPPDAAGGHRGD